MYYVLLYFTLVFRWRLITLRWERHYLIVLFIEKQTVLSNCGYLIMKDVSKTNRNFGQSNGKLLVQEDSAYRLALVCKLH